MLGALLLLWPPVQTRVVAWLSGKASTELGTEVSVGRVAISLRGQLVLDRIYIADLDGDTLIAVGSLRVKGLRIHPRAKVIAMGGVDLSEGRFNLRTPENEEKSNLTLLLDRLGGSDTTASGEDWAIHCKRFNIEDFHFSYHNANVPRIPFGIDFEHVEVTHAHIAGRSLEVIGDSVEADLYRMQLLEHGGLVLEELSGHTAVSGRGIRIQDLRLRTPLSSAEGELDFSTDSWLDYNAFNERVRMKLELDTAHVDFADIALFAPDLQGISYPIEVSGRVRGTDRKSVV